MSDLIEIRLADSHFLRIRRLADEIEVCHQGGWLAGHQLIDTSAHGWVINRRESGLISAHPKDFTSLRQALLFSGTKMDVLVAHLIFKRCQDQGVELVN